MMADMVEDLLATLGRVESPTLEFKREAGNRDVLRKAICALANDLVGRGGGDLLIGVDRDGRPFAIDTSDEGLFDAHPLAGTGQSDLDVELLRSTYLVAAVDPEVVEENDRPLGQQLKSLRLVHPTGLATPLGILLGGFDPTSVIPGAYLQFVRYLGVDADAPIRDEEEIRDNLITGIRTLTALLQANVTREVKEVDPLTERAVDDYPLPALREAIFNAVVHRTYEVSNAPIRILWFDDRVEVTNPGGPFGAVSPENFDQVNDYRNPSLAAAMKTLGFVNRFGRGIERMRLQMRRNGNPAPEFEVTPSWWRVTLRRAL
jgi:ATP-dependent DNA helicase RecG